MLARRLAVLIALSPLALAVPAWAQGAGGGVGHTGFQPPVSGVGQKPVVRQAPPPGIPGAQSPVNPPQEAVPLDMPPTEALFEAINRGDMAQARDALNRGADLNGRNVLGMTPIDLSVDLNRSDITFLLLSLRNQSTPPAIGRGPVNGPVASVTAVRPKPRPQRAAVARREVPVTGSGPVRYASVPAPPVPQSGFLGFGGSASP